MPGPWTTDPSAGGSARLIAWACSAAAALFLALPVGSVRADDAARIVVADRGSPDLALKIRAEAANVGFLVVEGASGRDGETAATLLGRYAAAALVTVASRREVEVVFADGQRRSLRRSPTDGSAFPLRVAEEVRAHLVELRIWAPVETSPLDAGTTPAPQKPPAPSVAPRPAPSPRLDERPRPRRTRTAGISARFWLLGGGAVIAPRGGVGPSGHGVVGLRLEPSADWDTSLAALLPVTENEVADGNAEADVNVNLFTGEARYRHRWSTRWLVGAGLGGGVVLLAMRADAPPPLAARDDRLVSGIYYVTAGVGYLVAPWLRVRAALLAGASAPRPVLRFRGRDVATWGRLFGGATLATELALPPVRDGTQP